MDAGEWLPVLPRPIAVISLRHPSGGIPWESTWLQLTAFLFNRGISDDRTVGIEILYDDPESTAPDRRRFDACLSVPRERIAGLSLLDPRRDSLGIRVLSVLDERLLLWRGDSARADPSVRHRRVGAVAGPEPVASWPRYRIYRGSPVLSPGRPETVGWYATAEPAAPATAPHEGGHLSSCTQSGVPRRPYRAARRVSRRGLRP
ncbi:hypothetical protein [Kitasatospora brasiliensis]|uniref:hypothetical protein n=1 Tax=Kitasatospora brasiliensis TaxID=3058040 RepID=UPI00292E82A7|nr:hypothetical protein [Kitasatospora sp. K002]